MPEITKEQLRKSLSAIPGATLLGEGLKMFSWDEAREGISPERAYVENGRQIIADIIRAVNPITRERVEPIGGLKSETLQHTIPIWAQIDPPEGVDSGFHNSVHDVLDDMLKKDKISGTSL